MGISIHIYNIVLFNIGWFCCVLMGNTIGLLSTAVISWLHIQFVSGEQRELSFMALVVMIGVVCDSLMFSTGILVAPSDAITSWLPPFWMILLWWLFATTINHSLGWLQDRLLLACILGAVAGPLTYYGGAKLSNITIGQPLWLSLTVLSIAWAIVMPLLLVLAKNYGLREETGLKLI